MPTQKASRTKASGKALEFLSAMATKRHDSVLQGQAVVMLNPEQIIVEKQVRRKILQASVEEMAHSIQSVQQQQPIIVRRHPTERDKFILEKGQRRLEACRLLGIQVASVVSGAKYDRKIAHASQLIENIQREDLDAYEVAHALEVFVTEDNMSQRAISEFIGKPKSYVTLHLSLLKASEGVRSLHDEELIRDADTLNHLRLLIEAEPEWEAELIALIRSEEGITRAKVRQWNTWAKEAIQRDLKPSEYILAKQASENEQPEEGASQPPAPQSGTDAQTGMNQQASSERPGRNVGEGSMLDSHTGPLTDQPEPGAQQDTAGQVTTEKTTTTTTTTTEAGSTGNSDETAGAFGQVEPQSSPDKKPEQQTDIFQNPSEPQETGATTPQNTQATPPAAPASKPIVKDGYVEYPVGQLELCVVVDGQQGTLMPTRLDDDEDYVWVMLDSGATRCKSEDVQIYCMQLVGS